MRIAFISPGGYMEYEDYLKGNLLGTENQIFGLSKELAKKGHEVYIIRRWYESRVEDIENVRILSLKSVDSKKPGLKLTFSKLIFSKTAAKTIKNIGFDILIIIDPFTTYFLHKLPIPKVLVTHTMIPYKLLPTESLGLSKQDLISLKVKKIIQKDLYDNSDVIVALNNEIKDYLVRAGHRTVFIPNGVDIEGYNSNHSDRGYVFYAGRLVKGKEIHHLIKAYSMLDNRLQNQFKLVIAGEGPIKENLKKFALTCRIKDNVDFIPFLPTLEFIEKTSECSVFVLPSLYECMPVTVLEAMALSKPVIASNISGPKGIIENEHDGFLFDDINGLKKYLELCLSDEKLRRTIGSNARKTVEEEYTFSKIADQYINLFDEVLERW